MGKISLNSHIPLVLCESVTSCSSSEIVFLLGLSGFSTGLGVACLLTGVEVLGAEDRLEDPPVLEVLFKNSKSISSVLFLLTLGKLVVLGSPFLAELVDGFDIPI